MTPEERAQDFLSLGTPMSRFLFAEFKERLVVAIRSAEREAKNAALEEAAGLCDRTSCRQYEHGHTAKGHLALTLAQRIRSLKEKP